MWDCGSFPCLASRRGVRYRLGVMWTSRRDVAWHVATIPVALLLGAVAFATRRPILVSIVGILCWIVIISVFYHRRG